VIAPSPYKDEPLRAFQKTEGKGISLLTKFRCTLRWLGLSASQQLPVQPSRLASESLRASR